MGDALVSDVLRADLERAAAQCGCELVHIEFRAGILRLVIDHPAGVTLDHCEAVSEQASVLLDAQDWGRGRYTLEVTSPGLDRQLYRKADFERFAGHLVKVRYRDPVSGQRVTQVFQLLGIQSLPKGTSVELADVATEAGFSLPFENIDEARLAWDWPKWPRKQKEDRSYAASTKHRRRSTR